MTRKDNADYFETASQRVFNPRSENGVRCGVAHDGKLASKPQSFNEWQLGATKRRPDLKRACCNLARISRLGIVISTGEQVVDLACFRPVKSHGRFISTTIPLTGLWNL